jgi:hypothetical protein
MADDDMVAEEEFEVPEDEPTEDVEPGELDEDELEEGALEDDEFASGDEFDEAAEDEEDDTDGPVRKSVPAGTEEDDDDDDMLAPDDVEADLDTILKDRLVAADDEGNDDDEEPEDRTETGDRLQPKRADEQLCPSCFLLVRQNAPICPVGDDDCPLFS